METGAMGKENEDQVASSRLLATPLDQIDCYCKNH